MSDTFTPVFNFDDSVPLTSEAELTDLLEATESSGSGGGKVFRPGTYDLKVIEVRPISDARNDKSWMNVLIRLGGTGDLDEKSIGTFVMVPKTNKLSYSNKDGKASGFPFKSFVETMAALGITVTRETAKDVVLQYFAPNNLGVLVGREVKGRIGYNAAHAKFIKEGEDGGYVAIIDNGEELKDDSGSIVRFEHNDEVNGYTDAEAYAKEKGLRFQAFPEILELSATEANSPDSAGNEGW